MVSRQGLSASWLVVVWAVAAPAQDETPKKPDPPGTARYMTRFRDIFAAWDLDKDGLLDKAELARAFRGPTAKPYDVGRKESEYATCSDYNFLVQLDVTGDKKISRDEFELWARNCAVLLKRYRDNLEDVRQIQAGLARATSRAQRTRLQRELTAARRTLAEARDQLQKLQQHFQHSQKKGS